MSAELTLPALLDSFGTAENMVSCFNDFATSPDGLAYANASGEVPGREFSFPRLSFSRIALTLPPFLHTS